MWRSGGVGRNTRRAGRARSRPRSWLAAPAGALLAVGVVIACAIGALVPDTTALAATTTSSSSPAATGSGWMRVGHFAPSEGPVTVTVDGAVLGNSITFRTVTSYVPIPAGTHTIAVRSATGSSTARPLVSGQATVTNGGAITAAIVAASGSASSSGASGALQIQTYTDDLTAPPSGDAKVRIIHTMPGTPAVTAHLKAAPAASTTALSSEPALSFNAVGYGDASPYSVVPAGTYQLTITTVSGTPVVSGQNWPVNAGTVASIVLLQSPSGPTVEVLSDAAGVTTSPSGAMQTGFGGTASHSGGPLVPSVAALTVLLFGAAALRRLRWHRRPVDVTTPI